MARCIKGMLCLCLCLLVPLVAGAQEIDETKVDKLLLVIFEVATAIYFIWTLRKPQFYLFFFMASLIVLIWNGLFVGWSTLFYINLAAMPVTFVFIGIGHS